MYNILICDDQPDIVNALKIYLSMGDYRLFEAYTGRQAVELVQKEEIHLILMDIMMPEMDGIAATQRIREFSNAPIILLTAKSENEDKVLGLNVGADDYITKPFVPMEVLAGSGLSSGGTPSWAARLRRSPASSPLAVSVWTMKPRPSPWTENLPISPPMEFSILRLLMSNPGRFIPPGRSTKRYGTRRPWAAREPWRYTSATFGRKIEINPSEPRYLKVVWGQGYKMEGENPDV